MRKRVHKNRNKLSRIPLLTENIRLKMPLAPGAKGIPHAHQIEEVVCPEVSAEDNEDGDLYVQFDPVRQLDGVATVIFGQESRYYDGGGCDCQGEDEVFCVGPGAEDAGLYDGEDGDYLERGLEEDKVLGVSFGL